MCPIFITLLKVDAMDQTSTIAERQTGSSENCSFFLCNFSSFMGDFPLLDKGVNASIGKARKHRLV